MQESPVFIHNDFEAQLSTATITAVYAISPNEYIVAAPSGFFQLNRSKQSRMFPFKLCASAFDEQESLLFAVSRPSFKLVMFRAPNLANQISEIDLGQTTVWQVIVGKGRFVTVGSDIRIWSFGGLETVSLQAVLENHGINKQSFVDWKRERVIVPNDRGYQSVAFTGADCEFFPGTGNAAWFDNHLNRFLVFNQVGICIWAAEATEARVVATPFPLFLRPISDTLVVFLNRQLKICVVDLTNGEIVECSELKRRLGFIDVLLGRSPRVVSFYNGIITIQRIGGAGFETDLPEDISAPPEPPLSSRRKHTLVEPPPAPKRTPVKPEPVIPPPVVVPPPQPMIAPRRPVLVRMSMRKHPRRQPQVPVHYVEVMFDPPMMTRAISFS
jgi:hypothetical protein